MNALSALLTAPKLALKAKFRLYLEYALMVLLVITAAAAFWNYMQNKVMASKIDRQQVDLKLANDKAASFELALSEQKGAIRKVSELRQLDSDVLSGLQEDLRRIGARDDQITRSIAILEKNSAEVRDYMAGPVPTALACVLDKTCAELASDSSGKAGAAVPAEKHPPAVRGAKTSPK